MSTEPTSIQVSQKTKELLGEYGKKSETYDEIIQRLFKEARKA